MIRILYWNIENFNFNKINAATASGARCLEVILQHLRQVVGPVGVIRDSPDIFAIVEVGNRAFHNPDGDVMEAVNLATGGVIALLNAIRGDPNIRNALSWCLIPPIISGNIGIGTGSGFRESIAVFYDSTNLIFTGPNVYTHLPGPVPAGAPPPGKSVPHVPGATVPGNYPAPFTTTTPATSTLPANTPSVAGLPAASDYYGTATIPQNQLAGRWEFNWPAVVAAPPTPNITFPPPGYDPSTVAGLPFPVAGKVWPPIPRAIGVYKRGTAAGVAGHRNPFLVTFWDTALGREIQLLLYHSSPGSAVAGTAILGYIQELQIPLHPQVSVIAGDFNVNACSQTRADFAFSPLIALGYVQQIQRPAALIPSPLSTLTDLQKGYCATMLKTMPLPYSRMSPADNYPSFGAIFNVQGDTYNADNIFIRYTIAPPSVLPAAPNNTNTTIVNLITGSPYMHARAQNIYLTTTAVGGSLPVGATGYEISVPPPAAPPAILRDRRLDYAGGFVPGAFRFGGIIHYDSVFFPYEPLASVEPVAAGAPYAGPLLPVVLNGMYYANDMGRNARFIGWNLYRKIRETSDHLAIITDV